MKEIRKYKTILAALFTLVFLMYIKQAAMVDTSTSIDKPEKIIFKNAPGFFSNACIYKQVKVKESNTHSSKKNTFDKTLYKLLNIPVRTFSECFSINNYTCFSGISILKLICTLRI